MVLSHGNTHSDTAKMEQIITEFFAKSLHIILESRAPYVSSRNSYSGDQSVSSPSSSPSVRRRDKWFNLALRECPAVFENINNLKSIIIDVILVHRPLDLDPMIPKRVLFRSSSFKERYQLSDGEAFGVERKSERIVERWVVQYENRKINDSNSGTRRSSNVSLQNLYKKCTLLLRSLYATVRLLPAYKTFRDLNSSARIHPFTLAHRVSSFVEPFTRKEESDMMQFRFTPVDTSSGRLCVSVIYCPSASDLSSEPLPSLSPQVISDYVGSPSVDPLKRFPSLPLAGLPCPGPPSLRRHSWNFDDSKASSPSITDSSLPPHPTETPLIQKKDSSFDDCYFPNPSRSIYNSRSSASKTLLRSESAPVRIPNGEVANSPVYSDRHNLPSSPPFRGSKCTYKIDRSTNVMQTGATDEKVLSLGKNYPHKHSGVRISTNGLRRISISRSSSRSYQDDFEYADFSCPFDVEYDDMADLGSRAESLNHGHMVEAHEAGGLFPIRKSNYAAVGVLVHMLKKAPPLHQDFHTSEHPPVLCRGLRLTATPTLRVNLTTTPIEISIQKPNTERPSHDTRCEIWNNNTQELNKNQKASKAVSVMSSEIIETKKTTRDALEEFHGYREMKKVVVYAR